jgi:hypothetical protein
MPMSMLADDVAAYDWSVAGGGICGKHCKAILAPLALLDAQQHALGFDVRHLQRHDFGDPQSGAIGGAQCGLVLRPGGRLQQPCDLLQAQDPRDPARLPHECEVPCHLGAVERHGEEETQRHNRAIDARRTSAGLCLMQLGKGEDPQAWLYPARGRERLYMF